LFVVFDDPLDGSPISIFRPGSPESSGEEPPAQPAKGKAATANNTRAANNFRIIVVS
jgi:hypothetical protein